MFSIIIQPSTALLFRYFAICITHYVEIAEHVHTKIIVSSIRVQDEIIPLKPLTIISTLSFLEHTKFYFMKPRVANSQFFDIHTFECKVGQK